MTGEQNGAPILDAIRAYRAFGSIPFTSAQRLGRGPSAGFTP
jgi:hypothetical protein